MSDVGDRVGEGEPTEITTTSLEAGTVIAAGVVGDQTLRFEEANIQIQLETAAHRREIERQRVARALESEAREEDEKYKDRYHQRIRNNCTYSVVVGLIIVGLVGTFYVAVTSDEPSLQAWAQNLTTTIAGVVGGAFAGYLIGEKR